MKHLILFLLTSLNCFSQGGKFGALNQPALYFEGNSLLTTESFSTNGIPNYIPEQCRSYLAGQGLVFAYHNLGFSGRTQSAINVLRDRFNAKTVNQKTVILIWEGTNEADQFYPLTGAQLYDSLMRFVNHIKQFTNKYLIVTTTARDVATDPSDLWSRLQAYNALIVANHPAANVCDVAALPYFDSKADCSDLNYYKDKLHFMKRGQDTIVNYLKPKLLYLLNN